MPVLKTIAQNGTDVIALIKPQFEAEREQVGKKGVIKDKKVHVEVLEKIISFVENEGMMCKNLSFSPITGGEGNIEFLAHLYIDEIVDISTPIMDKIPDIVKEAHDTLK